MNKKEDDGGIGLVRWRLNHPFVSGVSGFSLMMMMMMILGLILGLILGVKTYFLLGV